jgi:hypothetical protein
VGQVVQVEVERVGGGTAPGPHAGARDRRSSAPLRDAGAGRAVIAGVAAGQPVDGDALRARRVGRPEREAVGQVLGGRAVEMDLELVTAFGVEAGYAPRPGERGVDDHRQDRRVVAVERVNVGHVQPGVAARGR